MAGHDIRLIDEDGGEVERGRVGEVVGRSEMMMGGYHNLPEKTRDAELHDRRGRRFIRTGDVGRIDEDGFLILLDRSKDLIISGGFNIYPSDIEAELVQHEAVIEAAVVGVASERVGRDAGRLRRPAARRRDRRPGADETGSTRDSARPNASRNCGSSRACHGTQSERCSNASYAIYILMRDEEGLARSGRDGIGSAA